MQLVRGGMQSEQSPGEMYPLAWHQQSHFQDIISALDCLFLTHVFFFFYQANILYF